MWDVPHERCSGNCCLASWANARAHLKDAANLLDGVALDEFDGFADRTLAHEVTTGEFVNITGTQYVLGRALPQAAFHQMIICGILRRAGVVVGKVDRVTQIFGY